MSYDLNFLEACKALQKKECTTIENEFGSQYTINRHGTLSVASDPHFGIKRTPGGFLVNWKLVDKIPVKHEKVIENVIWHKEPYSGVVYPYSDFPWDKLITKPKMQVTLRWKE